MKLPDNFISLRICFSLAVESGMLLGSIGTVCKFQQDTKPIAFLYGRNRIHFKFHIFFKVEFLHRLSLRSCPLRNKRVIHKCNDLIFLVHNLTVVFIGGMNRIVA